MSSLLAWPNGGCKLAKCDAHRGHHAERWVGLHLPMPTANCSSRGSDSAFEVKSVSNCPDASEALES